MLDDAMNQTEEYVLERLHFLHFLCLGRRIRNLLDEIAPEIALVAGPNWLMVIIF